MANLPKFKIGDYVELRYRRGSFVNTAVAPITARWRQWGSWRYQIRFDGHYYMRIEKDLKGPM